MNFKYYNSNVLHFNCVSIWIENVNKDFFKKKMYQGLLMLLGLQFKNYYLNQWPPKWMSLTVSYYSESISVTSGFNLSWARICFSYVWEPILLYQAQRGTFIISNNVTSLGRALLKMFHYSAWCYWRGELKGKSIYVRIEKNHCYLFIFICNMLSIAYVCSL